MGLLEQIQQMKKEGISEEDITTKLQEQGIAPKSIMEAFNQEQIKNAVSAEPENGAPMNPEAQKKNSRQSSQFYTPRTQEAGQDSEFYAPRPREEMQAPYPGEEMEMPEQYSQEEYYPQEGYSDYGSGGYDTDTQIEIAEQVFAEKIKKFQKQIEALNEFANLAETKISSNHERIKRIESMIDKLQVSILEKIGDYGKNISGIKSEMQMMQDSFSKMIPELKEKHKTHSKKK